MIEDDMSVQSLVTQALRNAGYQVLAAGDMQEALHLSDNYRSDIHLILTDIMLPTSNGMALAEALLEKRPKTPVLYMSGMASEAIHAIQFEGAPIGEFIEKPFSPASLVTRIQAILLDSREALASAPKPVEISRPSDEPAAPVQSSEALYRLESPVKCPQCRETIATLQAVRLLRTQVNFTSTLPRRGRVLVCPRCASVVSAELTAF